MSAITSTPLGIQNYFLIRRINKREIHFVTLESEQPVTLKYPVQYLYREALKEKGQRLQFRTGLNSFIRAIQEQCNNKVMQYHVIQSSTYLTGRYFTLGLRYVSGNTTHRISKFGNNIPMQLFICKEYSKSKFYIYVNRDLAIVNKMVIKQHFRREKIERESVLPSGTIYFFYTTSHCVFELVEDDEQQSVPVTTISSTDEAGTSSSTNQSRSLESILNNLPDSARAQSAMSFVDSVEVTLKQQGTTDDVHAQTMEGSGDNSDDTADDGESFNDVVDCYRDENVALKYALADKEEKIAELEGELAKMRREQTGSPSPSTSGGISLSPRGKHAELKRKLSSSSDDCEFRESVNGMENERKSLLNKVESINGRLREKYDGKIFKLEKLQVEHEGTIKNMQERINELDSFTETVSSALENLKRE